MLPPPQMESQVAALMEWLCNTCLERLASPGRMTGTGPCVEAWRDGEPVLIPDLEAEAPGREPEVSNRALAAGVRARSPCRCAPTTRRSAPLTCTATHPGRSPGCAAAVERGQPLAQVCDDLLTGRPRLS